MPKAPTSTPSLSRSELAKLSVRRLSRSELHGEQHDLNLGDRDLSPVAAQRVSWHALSLERSRRTHGFSLGMEVA
jgi:hypothetical protein